VHYLEGYTQLDHKAALALAHREDLGRRRYLRKYFDCDIDDPLLYNLVINTDIVPYSKAANLIAQAVTPVRAATEALP